MPSPLEYVVRTSRLAGVPGDLADSAFSDKLSYVNDDPRAAQINTITTPADPAVSPGASHVYSLDINGVTISYASDASPTRAEVAEGLANAINAEPLVNGTVVASFTATTTVITARVGGEGFDLSNVDSSLTNTATQANATADPVGFGLVVIDGGNSSNGNKLAKLVNNSDVSDLDDLALLAVGVTIRDHSQEVGLDSLNSEYAPNEAMSVLRNGRIVVAIEADLTAPSDLVYVRTVADGALDNVGGFAPAAGTGLVQWTQARWVKQLGPGLALLEVNL